MYLLDASDLAAELAALRIGKPVVEWYQAEIARLRPAGDAPQADWPMLERENSSPCRDRERCNTNTATGIASGSCRPGPEPHNEPTNTPGENHYGRGEDAAIMERRFDTGTR